jgi:type IV secretory pathway TraG/TraD family ATPase VirD4
VHPEFVTQAPALLRGGSGLLAAYATAQLPMAVALFRRRAPLRRLLLAPLAAAPVTVLAGIGTAALAPVLHSLGFAADGALTIAAGFGLTTSLGYAAGRALARGDGTTRGYRRGALVLETPPPAVAHPEPDGRARGLERAPGGITLAGVSVSAEDEVKHFKLIGTTGTGKSTAIHELLGAALARGDRAVIADPDGGYLRRFYDARRGDVILNPFEPDSHRWDLFGEIANDYDVEQLARSLIPDHEGSDRSWRGYARTFFSAVTAQAHAAGSRDLQELYRLLVVAGTAELRTLVAGTPAQPFLEEHNGRMFDSIRSVTSSAVASLDYVARQRSAPLSVRHWVQERDAPADASGGRRVLFMPYRAGQVAALRSTISAWMRLAIFEAMQREEGSTARPLWFIVDELDALGQIDGLKDALARLRKFGGRCVLGFQSVAQVSSTYGVGEAQTIVENTGNTVIFRCSGSEHGGTSRFASRLIGEREVVHLSSSYTRRAGELRRTVTCAEHLSVEAAVMASQIEQLPDLSGYLKLASAPEWRRVTLRALPRERPGFAAGASVPLAVRTERALTQERAGHRAHQGLEWE